MKFSILSVATLALSAVASPIMGGAASTKEVRGLEAPKNGGDVVVLLQGTVKEVKKHTGALNTTLTKVDTGDVSKEQAGEDIIPIVEGLKLDISKLVNSLTTAAGIPVSESDVDRVLVLVNILLSELLATVKTLVTILGLRPQLTVLLKSVFHLVANLLVVLIGLLGGLVPGLVAGLSPLLAGLGNGLLAPLLTPIVALVASLAGP